MTSDVLANAQQRSAGIEQPGRVQAAGQREPRLAAAKPLWKSRQERRRHAQRALDARGLDRDRLERSLPADAAGRGGVEAPLQSLRVEGRRVEFDRVRLQVGGKPRRHGLQPLGERKPEGELLVVTRRTHGHRDRTARDANLERLLHRNDVHRVTRRYPDDIDPARRIRHRPHAENVPAVVHPDEAPGAGRRLGT